MSHPASRPGSVTPSLQLTAIMLGPWQRSPNGPLTIPGDGRHTRTVNIVDSNVGAENHQGSQMATYQYRCKQDGLTNLSRPIGTAEPSTPCPKCGAEMNRVFTAPL